MPVSLDLLRTFLAVYRTGSITAAAQTLRLSQPAVTAQVKSLEAALERPLFDRMPRGVTPTAAADELARRVAASLDTLDAVVGARLPVERAVHLGGPAEFLSEQVVPMLAPLVSDGLRVRLTFGLSDDLLADLAAGRLDLVVSTIRPRHRGIQAEPVYDEEFVLVAAPAVAGRWPGELPLIAYAEDLPIVRRYWRTVFGRRPSADARLVIPDLRGVLNAVLAGMGCSVLPAYLCRAHLASGALVALTEPEVPPINTGYLAVRSGGLSAEPVARVHAHLLAAIRAVPSF
ncbi:LysR family transcriptional regulator [Nonomuraea roseoviolacea subsp. roseoviolacea]|uniref:DNA-binding transcriptional LysR family regulator n=1 Tax=Nonomuraea roseoviolacea subsp. carminata TaxID=160689 RepID=A0ABT1JUQ0_9ACTN|nr:LysR family transcriptional regulator [Nonomuraea roseoviolacea]MCP2345082.1 DNA-binding transcriptional LysR family regulator [Nonomuraea roseoviolacea subsp. carminata]